MRDDSWNEILHPLGAECERTKHAVLVAEVKLRRAIHYARDAGLRYSDIARACGKSRAWVWEECQRPMPEAIE
jgi:hypothetical protein